jgi:hypothetical protein
VDFLKARSYQVRPSRPPSRLRSAAYSSKTAGVQTQKTGPPHCRERGTEQAARGSTLRKLRWPWHKPRTVEVHKTRIMEKLEVRNVAG